MKNQIENYFHLDSITEKIDELQVENKELRQQNKNLESKFTLTIFLCLLAIIVIFFGRLIWEL